ncbi:MAG: zinc ribbon domain-containing protein [Acidobacteria bacterium]|nr:zinc ribbon domain-containing protein [Acidobacteriota bacterium]
MPLYEYRCAQCEEVFEVRQKFADEPLTTHVKCGGKVVRLLSAPGLQFKGSGFYITDYAKAGSGAPKTEKKADAPAKTESKPAATPTPSTT